MKINSTYLNSQTLEEISSFFEQEGFIQLTQFLDKEFVEKFHIALQSSKNWKKEYNPLEHKFKKLSTKQDFTLEILQALEFFKSKEFIDFIEAILGFEISFNNLEVLEFSHGDFTILSDKLEKRNDSIELIFDMSDELEEFCGGTLTYTTKEEEVFYLNPKFNSLTLLYKPQEVMSYLKYLNNKTGNRKIRRIILSYQIIEE